MGTGGWGPNENGSGPNGGGPWYVRAIYQVGVPSAIALYLVYLLGQSLSADSHDTRDLVQQHMGQAAQLEEKINREQVALDILIQLEKFSCLHSAKSAAERTDCYEASKR